MTNPVDESDEIEGVDTAEEVCADEEVEASLEEDIISDDESKPVKKKVLALEARHKIEDYEIEKQMRDALDYLDDKKPKIKLKSELLKGSFHSKELKPSVSEIKPVKHKPLESPVAQKTSSPIKTAPTKIKPLKNQLELRSKLHPRLDILPKAKTKTKSTTKTNTKNTAHHGAKNKTTVPIKSKLHAKIKPITKVRNKSHSKHGNKVLRSTKSTTKNRTKLKSTTENKNKHKQHRPKKNHKK